MRPLLVSSGEPAGIGPDLCLQLAAYELPIVIMGDKNMLQARAKQLGLSIHLHDYQPQTNSFTKNQLQVLSLPCATTVIPGILNPENAPYVMKMLDLGVEYCLKGEFAALTTAPVHKAVINKAGFSFTGHTEFLAERCKVKNVVMLLACNKMKVALATTHLPLKRVAEKITIKLITEVVTCLHQSLKKDFGIMDPTIFVAGLNPHAGESGYLGHEELEVIIPALSILKSQGIKIEGPLPADTMFTQQNIGRCDVFLAMYHDQGLAVLKYASFGKAANITLGLPIIRTSVDHGTALDMAGTGKGEVSSLLTAVKLALKMAKTKELNAIN